MTLDEQINDILSQIRAAAKAGNQTRLRRIIRELVEEDQEQVHRGRLEEIGDDTEALCRYLGEIAVTKTDVEKKLGRAMTAGESTAFGMGELDRRIAARAVTVKTALSGGRSSVVDWMMK